MRIKGVEEPFEGLAFWVWAVYIFIYCVETPVEAVSQFKKTKQINTPKINNLSQMVKKKKAAIFIIQSTQGQWLLNRNMFPHRQFECFLGSGDLHFILSSDSMETLCAKRRHFIFYCAWLIIQSSTDDEQTHNVHSQTQICYIYKNTRKHKCSLLYINRTQYNFVGWMQRC